MNLSGRVSQGAGRSRHDGYSFVELLIVVTIVGILATAAIGLNRWEVRRSQEIELRAALRQLRSAIDAYHDAVEEGIIESEPDQFGYPPDLESLVEGVESLRMVGVEPLQPMGGESFPTMSREDDEPEIIKFLRRIPIDPMSGKADWGLRSYQDRPDSRSWGRENVYDVYSKSRGTAINGSRYSDW